MNRWDRPCPPISVTNRSMVRCVSLENKPVSSMMEGWYGRGWEADLGGGRGGTSADRSIVSSRDVGVVGRGGGGGGESWGWVGGASVGVGGAVA